jgi:16S rRNA (adenine1518-N6/adenine1519-N6)-dimethyltransferase
VNITRHRARKRFGQNFLIDQTIIDRIVHAVRPTADELLVEIGPGRGALTAELLQQANALIVIELDRDLAAALQQRYADQHSLQIIQADALKVDLSALATSRFRLVGNLPYNISSPLLFHFAAHREAWTDAHLMLQKEVAERLAANPGDSCFSRLSVMMSMYATTEVLFDVPPQAFVPQPKVLSSIVRLQPRQPEITAVDEQQAFARFVQRCFAQRRKTLANNLRGMLERAQINAAGIDPGWRPQQLGLQDYLQLFALYQQQQPI